MLGTSGFDIILLCWNGNIELMSSSITALHATASYGQNNWRVQYVIL